MNSLLKKTLKWKQEFPILTYLSKQGIEGDKFQGNFLNLLGNFKELLFPFRKNRSFWLKNHSHKYPQISSLDRYEY